MSMWLLLYACLSLCLLWAG